MRSRVLFLAIMLTLVLAMPASAQISSIFGSKSTGTTGTPIPSATPSYYSAPLAKPDFSAFSMRPSLPQPGNSGTSFLPIMPMASFRDSWLGRTIFGGPSMTTTPGQQAPPPPGKSPLILP